METKRTLFPGATLEGVGIETSTESKVKLIYNEDVGCSLISHYHHFLEFLLQALAALFTANLKREQVVCVEVHACCRRHPVKGNHNDINEILVKGIFPNLKGFGYPEDIKPGDKEDTESGDKED